MNSSPSEEQSGHSDAIATELRLPVKQVMAVVELLDDGNTIPFIARYRKEATGGLDETAIRAIEDALEKARELAARKLTVLKTIESQGMLSSELKQRIELCNDLATLEAIYLPFKPKRRTRASIAREQGLQPLANLLMAQRSLNRPKVELLRSYINSESGLTDEATVLAGALDIVAEEWSEDANVRMGMIRDAMKFGRIHSQVKRGKKQENSKFESYYDYSEPVSRIPSHRFLAVARGVEEGELRVDLELDAQEILPKLHEHWITNREFEFHQDLIACIDDCYSRLLLPATESSVLQQLKERADEEAIGVFGKNLRELLMAPPAGQKVTLGIDPGFRTGCKIAVVDATGKFLENTTIYPTPPHNDIDGASRELLRLIRQHRVELIAIGNGTASRETDAFLSSLIKEHQLTIQKVTVSEAGASIYSASEFAAREYPNLDVTIRGAISIAHRLQDPLAELVKADPKSIGVGQYQHDVNQKLLRKRLDREVESCVSSVGVDLNSASVPLLSYVAGIGPKIAENIVSYRDEHGRFESRHQLLKVPKLGAKAFEQAAGFLRIRNGKHPLDNSAVHPECYPLVEQIAAALKTDTRNLVGNATLAQKIQPNDFVNPKFGLPTILDVVAELAKPGRDPRSEFRVAHFSESVHSIDDLKAGMVLEGVITNVTHFGAFVDVGVHQDALIHISQLANEYVRDPNEVVAVGDIVKVKVIEVDVPRKRISATRKF